MSSGEETKTPNQHHDIGDVTGHIDEDGGEKPWLQDRDSESDYQYSSSTSTSVVFDSDEFSTDEVSFPNVSRVATAREEADSDGETASLYAATMYPRTGGSQSARQHVTEEDLVGSEVDGATLNSARTIYAEDYDFIMENGRRYCGDYYHPCDELEQTREWLIHSVYRDLFSSELTTVPLESPRYVLDIGTGIGEWAIDFAEKYPDCQVFGTDIAPLQPTKSVPLNVEFNLENSDGDWLRPADTFDLVHLRNMSGAFSDWNFIYQQAFHCLRPGGSIEILDFDDHRAVRNFLSFFPPGSPCHVLTDALEQAAIICGKPKGVRHMDPKLLGDAGFVDIQTSTYDMPIGSRENRTFGNKWLLALCLGTESSFLRPLVTYMGMDAEHVISLCQELEAETRKLADDPTRAKGFVVKLKVVVAKKPQVPGQWTARGLTEMGVLTDAMDIMDHCSGDEGQWTTAEGLTETGVLTDSMDIMD